MPLESRCREIGVYVHMFGSRGDLCHLLLRLIGISSALLLEEHPLLK